MDATSPSENNSIAEKTAARHGSAECARIIAAPSYDEPYRFGRKPTSRAPFPFTQREFARLLIVRSRMQSRSALGAVEA
jgi:hypothetical protein